MELQSVKERYGSAGIFVLRKYYEPLMEFGSELLQEGDSVIDGGANQGIYSCAFSSRVGPRGCVYAFEPQRYAVECLKRNLALNDFRNVVVFEGVLSQLPGESFLNLDRGPVSAYTSDSPQDQSAIKVTSYSIDRLFSDGMIKEVDFIKLDVEGAELSALTGAVHMIGKVKPRVCIEARDKELYLQISDLLTAMGYKAYVFNTGGKLVNFTEFTPSSNVFFLS